MVLDLDVFFSTIGGQKMFELVAFEKILFKGIFFSLINQYFWYNHHHPVAW